MDYDAVFESVMDFLEEDSDMEVRSTSSMAMEAMKKSDRDKLPDSAFALPKKRKYPINDEESVRNGIKYFRFVPKEDQKLCAEIFTKLRRNSVLKLRSLRGIPSINTILMSR